MHKLFYIILLMCVMSSCEKDCCTTIDRTIFLAYQDSSGQDLFSTDSTYKSDKIKIYYKKGNDYVYQNLSSNYDFPNGYAVNYSTDGKVFFSVFLSDYFSNNKSITLIELKPNVVDTIIGEFDLSDEDEILLHFWYNGELASDKSLLLIK